MKKAEVQIGQVYAAKVSGKLAPVKVDRASQFGGWDCTNLQTGRAVRIRGAAKLRCVLQGCKTEGCLRWAMQAEGLCNTCRKHLSVTQAIQ
jgi:hypothetical protein